MNCRVANCGIKQLFLCLLVLTIASVHAQQNEQPIRLHPENPHYFLVSREGCGFGFQRGALRGGDQRGV